MKCPVDESTLETHARQTIELEECPKCRGIWFKQDELRKTKDEVEANLSWVDFDPWSEQDKPEAKWSDRLCPVCNKKMASVTYPDTNVVIEYCMEKHGIWLDSSEFESIIESLEKKVYQTSLSEYMTVSLHEAREIISGREGFVSEWKDFLTVMRLLQYRFLAENPQLAKALAALQISFPH